MNREYAALSSQYPSRIGESAVNKISSIQRERSASYSSKTSATSPCRGGTGRVENQGHKENAKINRRVQSHLRKRSRTHRYPYQ